MKVAEVNSVGSSKCTGAPFTFLGHLLLRHNLHHLLLLVVLANANSSLTGRHTFLSLSYSVVSYH